MVDAGRHLFAIITGFALLFYPFGYGVFHLLVPTILTYLVMLQIREYSATLSWIINFTYLIAWQDSLGSTASSFRSSVIFRQD